MVKLLDFRPNQVKGNDGLFPLDVEDVNTMITEDYFGSYTPDMAQLRFDGPQYVFIWDNLKKISNLNSLSIEADVDWFVVNYNVYSSDTYVPFVDSQTDRGFLPDNEWLNKVSLPRDFKDMVPRKIQGRLIKCNMKTMIALDKHYSNGYRATRHRSFIDLPQQKRVAWVYTSAVEQFSKYDPHGAKYNVSSYIKPTLIPSSSYTRKDTYEYNAHIGR